jgi:hypothetical protein
MYAPEPFRNVGWWIAVAWHADGIVTDPITASVPTMQPPSANGTRSRLRWMAMSDARSYRQTRMDAGAFKTCIEISCCSIVTRKGQAKFTDSPLSGCMSHGPLSKYLPVETLP